MCKDTHVHGRELMHTACGVSLLQTSVELEV
jgi:hypothetical protein